MDLWPYISVLISVFDYLYRYVITMDLLPFMILNFVLLLFLEDFFRSLRELVYMLRRSIRDYRSRGLSSTELGRGV